MDNAQAISSPLRLVDLAHQEAHRQEPSPDPPVKLEQSISRSFRALFTNDDLIYEAGSELAFLLPPSEKELNFLYTPSHADSFFNPSSYFTRILAAGITRSVSLYDSGYRIGTRALFPSRLGRKMSDVSRIQIVLCHESSRSFSAWSTIRT
jgi:hypothetical protein